MRLPGELARRVRKRFAGRVGAGLTAFLVSFVAVLHYTSLAMSPSPSSQAKQPPTARAVFLQEALKPGDFPAPAAWEKAPAIRFATDWRGQGNDPARETVVRLLWNRETLFLQFVAKHRELYVFPDARADGWRDELWNRDVAEAFLQPETADPLVYKELEVSPNGFWIDLNIFHGQREEMKSGLRRRVVQDCSAHTWTAELAVPMKSLTPVFDPGKKWRANFYRVEGRTEPRFYAAWSPTLTPRPNFHVPEKFGYLEFEQ